MAKSELRKVIEQSTPVEWIEGLSWYTRAAESISLIAARFGLPAGTVAGVVAALSPMCKWSANLGDAERLIGAFMAGRAMDSVKVSTFNRNKMCAWRILQTSDPDCLSGNKVRAFYRNLTGDLSAPTIDRHAYNAYLGERAIIGDGGAQITDSRYAKASMSYCELAAEIGVSPAQLQAVIWCTWRRIHLAPRYRE